MRTDEQMPSGSRPINLLKLIQLLRPKQWSKNVFVFAAIIFSMKFNEADAVVNTIIATMSFSLLASSGYIYNDIRDVDADRNHPTKRYRPIACGAVSKPVAFVAMLSTLTSGVLLATLLGWEFLLVALLYFVTTIAYSLVFKHILILDVMFLSACYLWRAAAGAVAIGVFISPWLLTCTAFISLFLGFNKRRGELSLLGDQQAHANTRKNLNQYSTNLLVEFQAITTSGTIISYALYTVLGSPTAWTLLSLPHVLYGVFRYIYLVSEHREGGSPDETLLNDRPLIITGITYIITVIAVLLLHQSGMLPGE